MPVFGNVRQAASFLKTSIDFDGGPLLQPRRACAVRPPGPLADNAGADALGRPMLALQINESLSGELVRDKHVDDPNSKGAGNGGGLLKPAG